MSRNRLLRHGAIEHPLAAGEFFIGRESGVDLVLNDPMVSRRHCVIRMTDRAVTIVDLGSRNGVLVNGEKTEHRTLENRDSITIGTHTLQFHEDRTTMPGPPLGQREQRVTMPAAETDGASVFELLHGSAVRAIASGDLGNAESAARNLFLSVRAVAVRGKRVGPTLAKAVEVGLELHARTGDYRWAERLRSLVKSAKEELPAELAERVQNLPED